MAGIGLDNPQIIFKFGKEFSSQQRVLHQFLK